MLSRSSTTLQRTHRKLLLFTLTVMLPSIAAADDALRTERGPMVVYSIAGNFDEAQDALKDSITDQGLVLSNELHASDMLNRTGPDLGVSEPVYLQAATFEFCSSLLSHQLVALNPANMMVCPYAIGLYVLTKEPDQIHLAYRHPQGTPGSEQTTAKIGELLENIIESTLDFL